MSFSTGDVFPLSFTDLTSRKVRPAVVIGRSHHPGMFVVPISSQLRNIDLLLSDWQKAGLNVVCGIKAQIATVESRLVVKVVGKFSEKDQVALERQLRVCMEL